MKNSGKRILPLWGGEGLGIRPPGFRKFFEDPKQSPLPTPSGKLEFYSEALAKAFPDDLERPPIPKWWSAA